MPQHKGLTDGTNYVVCGSVHRRLEGYQTPARGESMGKGVEEAILSFPLCRCIVRDDATAPHQAASWATAVES